MSLRSKSFNLYKQGLYSQALDSLLEEDISPMEDGELAYLMGLCYTRLGEYDSAVFYLNESIHKGHSLMRSYQQKIILAYLECQNANFLKAEKDILSLLDEGYESVEIYALLGYIFWSQSKIDQSLVYYNRALKIDSENLNVLNALAYIMAEENIDLNQALTYAQQVVALSPLNPNYLDTLGYIYYKLGNSVQALNYLTKAFDLENDNQGVLDHLNLLKKG